MNISATGTVYIQFNNAMSQIEQIDSTLLEVKVLPSDEDTNLTLLNLTWEVVQQVDDQLVIQVRFQNPLEISAGLV